MKNAPFNFLLCSMVLGKSRCLSLCENKLHFNYMKFIKFLTLEPKQGKTGLMYKGISCFSTLKERENANGTAGGM